MTDDERNILDAYLDGELPEAERLALESRLADESGLGEAISALREERAMRAAIVAAMEGDDGDAERILASVKRTARRRQIAAWAMSGVRYAAAAAALIAIGFVIGWLDRSQKTVARHDTPAAVFRVAITDDTGRIVAEQKFDSLEKAREFSDDLRQWNMRQEQLRNGQVTVRSASF